MCFEAPVSALSIHTVSQRRAIARVGERLNGIQEVGGSIPPGSTILSSSVKGLTGMPQVRLVGSAV